MKLLIAVDAGNSKTIALAATLDGHIVGYGRSGCGDIHTVAAPELALGAVQSAIENALLNANATRADVVLSSLSMAGADWPEDYERIISFVQSLGFPQHIVVHDSIGGLRAGTDDGNGLAVILGTGVAIGARNDSRIWHSSFWTRSLDANVLEDDIYNAVLADELKHGPSTSLTRQLLQVHGKQSVEELIHCQTRCDNSEYLSQSKTLNALVEQALQGDEVACKIATTYANRCFNYALSAARNVGFEADGEFPIVFSGGLVRHPSHLFKQLIAASIHQFYPMARPIVSDFEPIIGAVFLALDTLEIDVSDNIKKNLHATMPNPSLFVTG